MKFSKRWLLQHLDAEIDTSDLIARLTMAGLEVDGVEAAAGEFTGVVVGEPGGSAGNREHKPTGGRYHQGAPGVEGGSGDGGVGPQGGWPGWGVVDQNVVVDPALAVADNDQITAGVVA